MAESNQPDHQGSVGDPDQQRHAGGDGHAHDRRGANTRSLSIVLCLTGFYMVAEVAAGFLTGSLALLADAGHMLTDVGGLALALFAMRLAERPATAAHTYGLYRAEILAAVANAILLFGISLFVLYEAYERFRSPPNVHSPAMLGVALVGLAVNILGVVVLRKGSKSSLNMQGAYFEVISDLVTSLGVIVAAIVMWTTGWYYADPLISAGIGLFILPRTWRLLREAVGVLLEGTPSDVNLAAVRAAVSAVPGVADLHDLHVWTITSGMNAMSMHAVLAKGASHDVVLDAIRERVTSAFNIGHVTVQVESSGCPATERHL